MYHFPATLPLEITRDILVAAEENPSNSNIGYQPQERESEQLCQSGMAPLVSPYANHGGYHGIHPFPPPNFFAPHTSVNDTISDTISDASSDTSVETLNKYQQRLNAEARSQKPKRPHQDTVFPHQNRERVHEWLECSRFTRILDPSLQVCTPEIDGNAYYGLVQDMRREREWVDGGGSTRSLDPSSRMRTPDIHGGGQISFQNTRQVQVSNERDQSARMAVLFGANGSGNSAALERPWPFGAIGEGRPPPRVSPFGAVGDGRPMKSKGAFNSGAKEGEK